MSTRATYRIAANSYSESEQQYFYIHYDGYPRGAVQYFKEFLSNLEDLIEGEGYRTGNCVVAFGMLPLSEFTRDHENHGDTEYRYNVYHDQQQGTFHVTGYRHTWGANPEDIWTRFFEGAMEDFIKKYDVIEGEE
jgi:hypothetical protein